MLESPSLSQSRTYLEINPADEPLQAETVRRSITDLHSTHGDTPTYEILIAATGDAGTAGTRSLSWYVGIDDGDLDTARRALSRCLPSSYDIVDRERSYAELLGVAARIDSHATDQAPAAPPLADHDVAAIEYRGVGTRPQDWMTPLEPIDSFAGADEDPADWPLSRAVDGLATGDTPALIQLLVTPKPDWTAARDDRLFHIENQSDLYRHVLASWVADFVTPEPEPDSSHTTRQTSRPSYRRDSLHETASSPTRPDAAHSRTQDTGPSNLVRSERRRIAALEAADTQHAFVVNARGIALDTDATAAEATLNPLRPAFKALATHDYRIDAVTHPYGSKAANDVFERILTRDCTRKPTRRRHLVPGTTNSSPAIIAGSDALGGLCLTGGPALSSDARRALETTPVEQTGLELPPRAILNRFLDADGMHIGHPRTANREPLDATVSIPPAVQPLHTAVFGGTGAGKTALGHDMLGGNYTATDGANIYLDSKGDGGPEAYLRSHYARHGDIDDIYYFDCEDLLPAFPLLSIEPQLEAGIDRQQAVENVADRHIEILAGYMGRDTFHSAPMAVDLVEALIKAMFDPVHGADTISQTDLLQAAARMHRTGEPPAVVDPHLRETLEDVTANSDRVFDNIMGAAVRRIRQATKDARLAPLFTDPDIDRDVTFDFYDHLDEQCVIIIDTSGYRADPRRLLTLTIVAELWTSLQRRATATDANADLPQVNLFLEEAAEVATSDVLTDLLAQGRSFGIGVTVMMQFPDQVRDSHPRVYRELINDIGTHITGKVNDSDALATPFSTDDHPPGEIATRIANLERGTWLVRPAIPFATGRPAPFYCESRPLPAGHPDGDAPLTGPDATSFDAELTLLETRMYRAHGYAVSEHAPTTSSPSTADTDTTPDTDGASSIAYALESTIQHTDRLPDGITYRDEPPYPLVCTTCDARYASTTQGIRNAITCCHNLEAVNREDIPITTLDVTLSAHDYHGLDYTDAQLRLLTAVYMAHQQRFDPQLEYDIVHDSMVRLQEYVGCDADDVDALIEDGLLKRDCTHPHYLYTVTPAGRDALGVGHREGIAHGDGKGDLSESSLHVALVEAGRRYLAAEFVADPDSPAVTAKSYHDVTDGRLDAAALDPDGSVVAALEAELSNHDTRRAVPGDFDKMAATDPQEAIWIVKNRAGAHEVLQALNKPADDDPRVEKTYSENMRPQDFTIDTPGLTDVYTFQNIRDSLPADHYLAPQPTDQY